MAVQFQKMGGTGRRRSAVTFYVVPRGHWGAPRMLAALAGLVHHRQRANGGEHNRDKDNN
jgi:hypothetical protein